MSGGDQAPAGSAIKTALHIITCSIEAATQPCMTAHLNKIESLIEELQKHIKLKLAVDVSDTSAINSALKNFQEKEFTLSQLSEKLNKRKDPVDRNWLDHVIPVLNNLKLLHGQLQTRAKAGILSTINSRQESIYPYNPYSFPWTHFDTPNTYSITIGLFEAHMKKIADVLKNIRLAELEIAGKYNPKEHGDFFDHFSWRQFSEEEFQLCPPLIIIGNDRSLFNYLFKGKPFKIVAIADGLTTHSMPLAAILHRDVFVLQSSMASPAHMMKGIMDAFSSKNAAFLNIFCSSANGHLANRQANLALKSRTHPFFVYDPKKGETFDTCLSLDGNPNMEQEAEMNFADFAVSEKTFQDQFKMIPENFSGKLVPFTEYMALDEEERLNVTPFIQTADHKRMTVSQKILRICTEKQNLWKTLLSLKRLDITPIDENVIANRVRSEVLDKVALSLLELAETGEIGIGLEAGH